MCNRRPLAVRQQFQSGQVLEKINADKNKARNKDKFGSALSTWNNTSKSFERKGLF